MATKHAETYEGTSEPQIASTHDVAPSGHSLPDFDFTFDVLFIVGAAHETTRRFTAFVPQVAAHAPHSPADQGYTQSGRAHGSTDAGASPMHLGPLQSTFLLRVPIPHVTEQAVHAPKFQGIPVHEPESHAVSVGGGVP
jgi:hypothetical protein